MSHAFHKRNTEETRELRYEEVAGLSVSLSLPLGCATAAFASPGRAGRTAEAGAGRKG